MTINYLLIPKKSQRASEVYERRRSGPDQGVVELASSLYSFYPRLLLIPVEPTLHA